MLDPVRIYATAIYIASIIVALFCAVYVSHLVPIVSHLLIFTLTFIVFSCLTLYRCFELGPEQAINIPCHCAGVWCSYLVCDDIIYFFHWTNYVPPFIPHNSYSVVLLVVHYSIHFTHKIILTKMLWVFFIGLQNLISNSIIIFQLAVSIVVPIGYEKQSLLHMFRQNRMYSLKIILW